MFESVFALFSSVRWRDAAKMRSSILKVPVFENLWKFQREWEFLKTVAQSHKHTTGVVLVEISEVDCRAGAGRSNMAMEWSPIYFVGKLLLLRSSFHVTGYSHLLSPYCARGLVCGAGVRTRSHVKQIIVINPSCGI